jgi:hypothetical protein
MKKIDILNFITSFRKAPNDIKTYKELVSNLNITDETALKQMLQELQQTRVLREVDVQGEKAYQVMVK